MKQNASRTSQAGVMLIEALIAILIFSVGVLGIIGMQASAIKASSDAQYRSEAALLANELIGRMWATDRKLATIVGNFTDATSCVTAKTAADALPPASPLVVVTCTSSEYDRWIGSATAAGTVLAMLPGASARRPTVTVAPGSTTAPATTATSLVTITIFWQVPGETTVHNYVTIAQVGG